MPVKTRVENTAGKGQSRYIKIVEENKMEKSQENTDCMRVCVCVCVKVLQLWQHPASTSCNFNRLKR